MKKFTLYGLKHPKENQIRYIGITSCSLSKRLYYHCRMGGNNPHKSHWVASMLPLKPEIVPYATGLSQKEACDLEILVIAKLRRLKYPLLNIAPGGVLPPPCQPGRKHSIETKKKLSIASTGKNNYFFGKKLSLEHRAKIAAAHVGKKHSSKSKRKIASIAKAAKRIHGRFSV